MNRTDSPHQPPAAPDATESNYLASTVATTEVLLAGPALIRGLAEVVERRPNDPIEYLATFLYKHASNRRIQRQREENARQLELEKAQAEENKRHRVELRNEIRVLREHEEEERQLRKVEEKRRQDAEDQAKRYKDMLTVVQPSLAVVSEEEDDIFTAEPGDTELHRQAALENVDLSHLLRMDYRTMGSRNAQGKTPRDVAWDAGLQTNVEKIDAYCTELLEDNNREAIQDLLLGGYTDLIKAWSADENESNITNRALRDKMIQFLKQIQDFQQAIKQGDVPTVESMLNNRQDFGLYRDGKGSSALHDAIEYGQYETALILVERNPSLIQLRDIHNRSGLDLVNTADEDQIADDQRDFYDKLKAALTSVSSAPDTE